MKKKFNTSHYIFGDYRIIEVIVNDDCSACIHKKVCGFVMENRCGNYTPGDSRYHGCDGCTNRYAKYDSKQPVACFVCDSFINKDSVEIPLNRDQPPR